MAKISETEESICISVVKNLIISCIILFLVDMLFVYGIWDGFRGNEWTRHSGVIRLNHPAFFQIILFGACLIWISRVILKAVQRIKNHPQIEINNKGINIALGLKEDKFIPWTSVLMIDMSKEDSIRIVGQNSQSSALLTKDLFFGKRALKQAKPYFTKSQEKWKH